MQEQQLSFGKDFLPDDHEYLTYIKKVFRHRCRQAGFRRVATPLLESAELCQKVYGESSEELNRQCLVSCGETEDAYLRFNSVFSLARAYVSNGMSEWPQPVELYYIDSYLGSDESGLKANDNEFGIQVIGTDDPALDAQVIYLGYKILDDLGLKEHYQVQINHIGSMESRQLYLEDLKNFYFDKERSLCEKCVQANQEGKFMKLLSCKEEDCAILAQLAPQLENYLTEEDQKRYQQLKEYLEELGVEYHENKSIFGRGLFDSHSVFEFWHNDKGDQNVIIYGGSNDEIIEKLGGEKANMVGFVSDSELLISNMQESGITVPHKDNLQLFVAQLGYNAKKKALSLLQKLREAGVQTVGAMGTGSMRTQLDMASSFNVKYTLLMGEIEVKEGMVIVRDMSVGTQESVPYDKVVEIMIDRIGKDKVDLMLEDEKSVDLKSKKKKK